MRRPTRPPAGLGIRPRFVDVSLILRACVVRRLTVCVGRRRRPLQLREKQVMSISEFDPFGVGHIGGWPSSRPAQVFQPAAFIVGEGVKLVDLAAPHNEVNGVMKRDSIRCLQHR